jgi:spermidine/putrescine transport system substrate-binding protein
MKKVRLIAAAAAAVVLAVTAAGCSKKAEGSAGGGKLYIYNWTYYTPDSVIEKFEKEYGIDVIYDSFASNEEMFAKLKAGGTGTTSCFPPAITCPS